MTSDIIVAPTGGELGAFKPSADWEVAVVDWLKNLKSDRTRKAYVDAWRDFFTFTGGKSPDLVSQSDVINYRYSLKTGVSSTTRKPFAQSTVNQRLSALSSFFDFAQGRGLRADNPVDGVKREAVPAYGKVSYLDVEAGEDIAFIEAIDTSTDQGKRDFALFLLYLTGGFRVSEVARLKVGDIRRQGRRAYITVTTKGNNTKEVAVSPEAIDAIDAYLESRSSLTDDSPVFVATDKGRRAAVAMWAKQGRDLDDEEKPLTTRAIRYLVDTYAKKVLGPGHGIHPHSLRHTAAHALEISGATMNEIKSHLGHKSLVVTQIYLEKLNQGKNEKTTSLLGQRYASRHLLAAD